MRCLHAMSLRATTWNTRRVRRHDGIREAMKHDMICRWLRFRCWNVGYHVACVAGVDVACVACVDVGYDVACVDTDKQMACYMLCDASAHGICLGVLHAMCMLYASRCLHSTPSHPASTAHHHTPNPTRILIPIHTHPQLYNKPQLHSESEWARERQREGEWRKRDKAGTWQGDPASCHRCLI